MDAGKIATIELNMDSKEKKETEKFPAGIRKVCRCWRCGTCIGHCLCSLTGRPDRKS